MKRMNFTSFVTVIILVAVFLGTCILGDEIRWMAVGNLHEWYSSAGCEIEVGRTHAVSDQQDGLRWPAQFRYQDCQVSKGFWIGAANYRDTLAHKTFAYKVVHAGPRAVNESNEFMPALFKLVAKYDHPQVTVYGQSASRLDYYDFVDEIDPDLPADRMLLNIVNTSIGVTMTRRIYAFSQQNHDNSLIYDYVLKNTGIVDNTGTQISQTLNDVVFFLLNRYAASREVGPYGFYWLPQSTSWGKNTMVDQIFSLDGNPFRAIFAWHGRHSKAVLPSILGGGVLDNIGGPNVGTSSYVADGRLGSAQFLGLFVIHADKSASDKSDDLSQPLTTKEVMSDDAITMFNDQFNAQKMTAEYLAMIAGRPALSHAERVGSSYADLYGGTPGGYSNTLGFGPYTMATGDSIHIVLAEAVAGLSRDECKNLGKIWLEWKKGNVANPLPQMPDGSAASDADVFKNAWVMTGRDSLFKAFKQARSNYSTEFNLPFAPPPPVEFHVASAPGCILLDWSDNASTGAGFRGYRLCRSTGDPLDSTFVRIFECGAGTAHTEVIHQYTDSLVQLGTAYYYYISSFDDGSANDMNPGVPLESSKFYTMTRTAIYPKKPVGLEEYDAHATTFSLYQNYPNPFNSQTTINFEIENPGQINLSLYDVQGRAVMVIDESYRSVGKHSVKFAATSLSSGIYLMKLMQGAKSASRKIIVIK